MFSGIVEAKAEILEFTPDDPKNPQVARLVIKKPSQFSDLSIGDSVAVDGVCLTVEKYNDDFIQFAVAFETLKVTGWLGPLLNSTKFMNLERSIRLGDRIHGHIVTGHIDSVARVLQIVPKGEARVIKLKLPAELKPLIWRKGSIAVNGVSLTVNDVRDDVFEVCLIPETLKRTNLHELKEGAPVLIEIDQMARGIFRILEQEKKSREFNS